MYSSIYRVGESLRVGDVTVTVLEARGGRVRLGLTAPKRVRIYRAEAKKPEPAAAPAPLAN